MTLLEKKYLFRSLFIISKYYNDDDNEIVFTVIGEPEELTINEFMTDLYSGKTILSPYENPMSERLNMLYGMNIAKIPLQIFNVSYPMGFMNDALKTVITPDFTTREEMELWIALSDKV